MTKKTQQKTTAEEPKLAEDIAADRPIEAEEVKEAEVLDDEVELPDLEKDVVTEEEKEPTPEESLAILAQSYAALEAEKTELDNKLLRMQADFDNFRRRTRQEKEEWRVQIIADFCSGILPVIDNFERALQAMEQAGDAAQHVTGVQMIARQLNDVLAAKGVEKIPAVGEPFDPKWHEAIGQTPVEAEEQVDTVVEEIRPGYKIGDKLIRVAMVRVGTKA